MSAIYKTESGGEAVRARYAALLEQWPVPHEQRRIATSQGEAFAISCGPAGAPDVVLLHGSAANSASWMGDVPVIARRFRVHAVDVIGEPGFSAPSRPPLASGAYAPWLGEVVAGLGIERAALVGISLGGWLALEYATHHPQQVTAMALLCPGGVGRQKNVLIWALPLLLLGRWGRQRVMARMAGRAGSAGDVPPAVQAFGAFMEFVFANFRPRTEKLPPFEDARLGRLTMPLLTVLGAKDVMIDSAGTRERLVRCCPKAEVVWLPEAGHLLIGHGETIEGFLAKAASP